MEGGKGLQLPSRKALSWSPGFLEAAGLHISFSNSRPGRPAAGSPVGTNANLVLRTWNQHLIALSQPLWASLSPLDGGDSSSGPQAPGSAPALDWPKLTTEGQREPRKQEQKERRAARLWECLPFPPAAQAEAAGLIPVAGEALLPFPRYLGLQLSLPDGDPRWGAPAVESGQISAELSLLCSG